MRAGRRGLLQAALALPAMPALAQAPAWPSRPVRIIIPFTPGGSNDAVGRPLAERLHARLGQPFVVENRPGAGSAVGVGTVAQSAPDGHTLMVTTSSVAAIAPVQRLSFDPLRDLDGVAFLAKSPLIVLVPPASPLRGIADLVRLAREKPGEVTFGSSGPGSTTHLATELFALRAGLRLQHVPYRGTAGALTDLVAGRIDVMFTTIASAAGQLRGNLVRLIAWCGEGRPEGTPDAPLVRDAGIDYEAGIWWGLFAPRGLPPAIHGRLHEVANEVLVEPAYRRAMQQEGAVTDPVSIEEFRNRLRREVEAMTDVVRAANVRAD